NAALPADKYLINVPSNFFWGAFAFPDFSALRHPIAWKWVLMFAVIASLESLLSAKAVDLLDPQRRKSDLNRDLLGCGVANLVSSLIGGLPMISEIVRSRANVDNQAKTRWSNACHGLCLLLFAAAFPFLLTRIPIAALSAMLVFTGFRLAHPREFAHMWHIGKEQFFVFVGTIVAVVLTDLLIGVAIGVVLELVINIVRGTPISRVFATEVEIREVDATHVTMVPKHALVFSNWLPVRAKLDAQLAQGRSVAVDLSETRVVDHTAMVKLNELVQETASAEHRVTLIGLDGHDAVADTPTSARLRRAS
ncbi:MAG TPA: SulP family inorganic anion transporter, partial [Pirellulaceae bacterium]|nr:SulP family inorganic anion transporter [Pirellulaceae bacterium]